MTEETKGMINASTMAKMKKGVRLLNCARGGIIIENDLVDAVKSGQVAGAALDVYEAEPLAKDHPLRTLSQVIMTPHLGASTVIVGFSARSRSRISSGWDNTASPIQEGATTRMRVTWGRSVTVFNGRA